MLQSHAKVTPAAHLLRGARPVLAHVGAAGLRHGAVVLGVPPCHQVGEAALAALGVAVGGVTVTVRGEVTCDSGEQDTMSWVENTGCCVLLVRIRTLQ